MCPCFKFGGRGMAPLPPLDERSQRKEVFVYKPFRWIGYFSSLAALTFALYTLANRSWIRGRLGDKVSIGIWDVCYEQMLAGLLNTKEDIKQQCKLDIENMPQWQSVIVGLLLFSLAAGFLACVLTTCGICVNSLAKKVYYYHSAGEIYFVCGICSMVALITYPAVLESSEDTPKHSYGIGYFLGWCMPICYYISAFCMTLDDMIHSITNDCCLFCRRGKKQTLDKVNV